MSIKTKILYAVLYIISMFFILAVVSHCDGSNSAYYEKIGYNKGFSDGKSEGFDEGYESGYSAGFESGRYDGYEDGYLDGCNDE